MSRALFVGRVLVGLAVVSVSGCRGGTSSEPPVVPFRGMHEMPRYDAQERSHYFEDHRTMRPPVEGTVAREMVIDPAVSEGVNPDGTYVSTIPPGALPAAGDGRIETAAIERGHQRFDIYCAPCHANVGDGQGMVTRRATAIGSVFAAANLHDDRLRHIPDGQLFATITNGVRTMPAYRAQIPVADRWAIVAYVRALQLSQGGAATASLDRDAQEARR